MKKLSLILALSAWAWAVPTAPPGPNVHLVQETPKGIFWRGGGPRKATLEALANSARERGVKLTLIDLRTPSNSDDRSGKDGRLSPADEEKWAREHGLGYQAVSALAADFPARLDAALARGDVYMHCMYGVNRTGFAAARWATAHQCKLDRAGLGEKDWNDGAAFQRARSGSK